MRLAIMSTFPPRPCGIATFSSDLWSALDQAPDVDGVDVIAVANGDAHTYPAPVLTTVAHDVRADYRRAARLAGRLGVDMVMIEHEFGIFGGVDGDYLLSFTSELAVPYAVTLHTVSASFTTHQRRVLRDLCRDAALVLVFTDTAKDMVLEQDIASAEQVQVVPHGAPHEITAVARRTEASPRTPLRLGGRQGAGPVSTAGRFVLSSFGLLSPGKGIETTIAAVSQLRIRHPEVLLVVAGRTHPDVVRREGEAYRVGLEQRVRELGLVDHVSFDDRFLDISELAELLAATDVFVTAYTAREQIVSGALTFALAAGRPVVSTPYRYAEDLLASGAGRLVPFGDATALAEAVGSFIESPGTLALAAYEARRVGSALAWDEVGRVTAALCQGVMAGAGEPSPSVIDEDTLPPVRLDHLLVMTDDVGIVQHAVGAVADRTTGYCVDDVARLLPVVHQLHARTHDPQWATVTRRALSFLAHAADNPQRCGMHNLMSYQRLWVDHPHHGDHVGRTVQALGEVLATDPAPALRFPMVRLFDDLCDDLMHFTPSPRTAAFALLGLCRPVEHGVERPEVRPWRPLVERLADQLRCLHEEYADLGGGWDWFEPVITYDNARLPQALMVAGAMLGDEDLVDRGLRTLRWYGDACGVDRPPVWLPGNAGRQRGEPHPGFGDEQPLEAGALVEAELDALRLTGDPSHARRAFAAFHWFLGANRLGRWVYDPSTGGCGDGLADDHVNVNQGAESLLAYLGARLALEAAGVPVIARHRVLRRPVVAAGQA
jgi:glycosyltransferase involved in cell wall biosynthesis